MTFQFFSALPNTAQKYEEAYEIFNSTQEWLAPDDETKAFIFMAMAAMLYGFNQLEECKTLLFQW